jgi:hypothetical protein
MTQGTWDYLVCTHKSYGQIVIADDILKAAWLIEAGYASAEDDCEGPMLRLTDAGTKLVSD